MSQHPGARKYWVVHPKNISGSKFVMGFSGRHFRISDQKRGTNNKWIHGGPGKPGGLAKASKDVVESMEQT